MGRRRAARCLLAAAVLAAATASCKRGGSEGSGGPSGPVAEGRALLERGELDAALARLGAAPTDPESVYYQGLVWARKAETAPLPTPPPPPSPLPRGAEAPSAPEFKPEELQALDLFERAAAARPSMAKAQLAMAQLLAPHAVRRHEQEEEAQRRPRRRGRSTPEPPPPAPPSGPDYSVERVLAAFHQAAQGDAARSTEPLEALITFAGRVGRLDDADEAYKELIDRDKENPDRLVAYGDFLLQEREDPDAAVAEYRQALIWRPEDDATRAKIAGVYIARGLRHLDKHEYALAEAQFLEARKNVTDASSAQGRIVEASLARLRSIRR
jgi:tetratricopeptide (TPR) repeat protein